MGEEGEDMSETDRDLYYRAWAQHNKSGLWCLLDVCDTEAFRVNLIALEPKRYDLSRCPVRKHFLMTYPCVACSDGDHPHAGVDGRCPCCDKYLPIIPRFPVIPNPPRKGVEDLPPL